MAHFAELDENNIVKRTIVIDNSELLDAQGVEQEALGIAYCERHFGGKWVQTSYNRNFRKHYAVHGFKYDENLDCFIPPQPWPSWIFNEEFAAWLPPVEEPSPSSGIDEQGIYHHVWKESTQEWVKKYTTN